MFLILYWSAKIDQEYLIIRQLQELFKKFENKFEIFTSSTLNMRISFYRIESVTSTSNICWLHLQL